MAVFSFVLLSGSTDGEVIPVAAVATPGTLLHTALTGTGGFDKVYLWASNVSGAAATLTIEWGGVLDPGDHLVKSFSIPANSGPIPIAVGQPLNNAKVIRGFSGTANVINISGFVIRIN